MTRKGAIMPGTWHATVFAWYAAHPGLHRCTDVARELDTTSHRVATASRILMVSGALERHQDRADSGRRITRYGVRVDRAVACPRCHSLPGEPCVKYVGGERKEDQIVAAHAERVAAGREAVTA